MKVTLITAVFVAGMCAGAWTEAQKPAPPDPEGNKIELWEPKAGY